MIICNVLKHVKTTQKGKITEMLLKVLGQVECPSSYYPFRKGERKLYNLTNISN